jgi:hypothetical protein
MAAHEEMCNEICVYRVICRTMIVYRCVSCRFLNGVTLYTAENINISVTCYEATHSSQSYTFLSKLHIPLKATHSSQSYTFLSKLHIPLKVSCIFRPDNNKRQWANTIFFTPE